jgi:translation initiation factor 2B subunit (eIF-2B alpha/beta/delta family)
MAKTKKDEDLFDRLRALGVRKGVARKVSTSMRNSSRPAPKAARRAMADLTGAVAEMRDRIEQGPQKRKKAAKKAARTRARKAERRSEAAQKAARTRAKAGT